MAKLDLNGIFAVPERKKATIHKTYDVRITLNKAGKGRQAIRFGFINKAASVFGEHAFIEASYVERMRERIYFRSHSEKVSANVHVLSSNGRTRKDSCYFTITPSNEAEKIYRMSWIGKTFPLLYDTENELYYIDVKEENN